MLHDGELRRVAGPQHVRSIAQCTAHEARDIDVGSWFGAAFVDERIPLLAEVLRRYRGRTHLHIVRCSTCPDPSGTLDATRACCSSWMHGQWHCR